MSSALHKMRCFLMTVLIFVCLQMENVHCKKRNSYYHRQSPRHDNKPHIDLTNYSHEVKVHGTVRFECRVVNLGNNVITWYNMTSNRVIFAGTVNILNDPRLKISKEGRVLHIVDISEFDAGKYKCQVETSTPVSKEHQLKVLVPPRVKSIPMDGNIVMRSNSRAELICHSEGSPIPKIRWTRKDGRPITNALDPNSEILKFPRVRKEDDGVYECEASNGVGAIAKAQIRLQVIYAPIVTAVNPKVYAFPKQRDVTLKCQVEGNPFPTVEWQHKINYQRPSKDKSQRMFTYMEENVSVLKLRRVDESDFGSFECKATNKEGSNATKVELTGEPQKPVILSPRHSSQKTSYTLRWSVKSPYKLVQQKVNYWEFRSVSKQPNAMPSDDEVRNRHYKTREEPRSELHLKEEDLHRLIIAQVKGDLEDGSSMFEIDIHDLIPNRVYVVQVQAFNKFKEGEWSDKYYFETSGKVSPLSVQGNLRSKSSHAINIPTTFSGATMVAMSLVLQQLQRIL